MKKRIELSTAFFLGIISLYAQDTKKLYKLDITIDVMDSSWFILSIIIFPLVAYLIIKNSSKASSWLYPKMELFFIVILLIFFVLSFFIFIFYTVDAVKMAITMAIFVLSSIFIEKTLKKP